jgi:hypothetical protein
MRQMSFTFGKWIKLIMCLPQQHLKFPYPSKVSTRAVWKQFVVPHSNSKGTVSFNLAGLEDLGSSKKTPTWQTQLKLTRLPNLQPFGSFSAGSSSISMTARTVRTHKLCSWKGRIIIVMVTMLTHLLWFLCIVSGPLGLYMCLSHVQDSLRLACWLNTSLRQGFLCGYRSPLPGIAIHLPRQKPAETPENWLRAAETATACYTRIEHTLHHKGCSLTHRV